MQINLKFQSLVPHKSTKQWWCFWVPLLEVVIVKLISLYIKKLVQYIKSVFAVLFPIPFEEWIKNPCAHSSWVVQILDGMAIKIFSYFFNQHSKKGKEIKNYTNSTHHPVSPHASNQSCASLSAMTHASISSSCSASECVNCSINVSCPVLRK